MHIYALRSHNLICLSSLHDNIYCFSNKTSSFTGSLCPINCLYSLYFISDDILFLSLSSSFFQIIIHLSNEPLPNHSSSIINAHNTILLCPISSSLYNNKFISIYLLYIYITNLLPNLSFIYL